jgi:hypothetical protein
MSTVKLRSLRDFNSLFGTGSDLGVTGLRLVESNTSTIEWITSGVLFKICTSFPNVKCLDLVGSNRAYFSQSTALKRFSENLTSLSLGDIKVHQQTFFSFLCMFPKLDNLRLDQTQIEKPLQPLERPAIIPSFQGKLELWNISDVYYETMVAFFLRLPFSAEFRELSLENCEFSKPQAQELKDLFVKWQKTVKKITISRVVFCEYDPFRACR